MRKPSLSRRDLLDFLDQAESKCRVDTWKINGVHVWPLIKIDLFFRHVNAENRDEALDKIARKYKTATWSKIVKIAISFIRFISLYLKRQRPITLFFSDSSGHRVMFNGEFIDRYFKPIADYLEDEEPKFKYLTVNDDLAYREKYPANEPMFFVHRYFQGAKLWLKLFNKEKTYTVLEGYNDFLSKLTDDKFDYLQVDSNYLAHIHRKIENVLAFSKIVQILIEKHTPKVIFELCYYSTLRFGINHAAFHAGVKTIEIQHGGMGRDHVSYSGWSKVPQEGYSLLPQTFWLWDESSKQLVDKWTAGHRYHTAVLGGNPWLPYVKEKSNTFSFPKDRSIILYTLQYSEIPNHVIEAIRLTSPYFQWWIRLHPRKLESKSIIKDILKNGGVDPERYEIEKATSYPLPAILLNTYVHLSGSSGAVIEAAQMGVFSLILEELGTVYYSDLISKGKARAALGTKEILDAISGCEGRPPLDRSVEASYRPFVKQLILENNQRWGIDS